MKTLRFCVLSFLLSTVAGGVSAAPSASGQPPPQTRTSTSSAVTLPTLDTPADGATRDEPIDRQNPNSAPMPAPAATDHYARNAR